MQEITPRARDSLVSFGERLSTRLLAGYLRRLEVPSTQFDAWRLGIVTSDEFTDAQVRCSLANCRAAAVSFLSYFTAEWEGGGGNSPKHNPV